jgi:hypothetical protein
VMSICYFVVEFKECLFIFVLGVCMQRSYWDFVKMAQGGASAIYGSLH